MEYFENKMRPFFVKGEQYVFLWRFLGLFKSRKANQDLVTWIAKFDILLQGLRNSWMDLLPEVTSADNPPEFAIALMQDPTFARLQDPTEQAAFAERQFREWNRQRE